MLNFRNNTFKAMKKIGRLLWIMMMPGISVNAQVNDTAYSFTLPLISQVNQGNSYITFPTDIGKIESLWFEGNLIPNFYLRKSHNSRLMGVLTPQIILRMYQEKSFPVRTPSYMPQITVYYRLSEWAHDRSLTLFGRIGHHSNGQEGDFFLENGRPNLQSGDFATNFLEAGLISTHVVPQLNAYQFFKSSLEIHPNGLMQEELSGIYSQYRWHNAFSVFKLSSGNDPSHPQKPDISIKSELTWMFGNFNHLATLSGERLKLSLTFFYHPEFLEDIGLFVQYYHGSDYYNIYFDHRLDVLRFGLMTEKLRF